MEKKEPNEWICDDRNQHEEWEAIKKMSEEEFERHIEELKRKESEKQK